MYRGRRHGLQPRSDVVSGRQAQITDALLFALRSRSQPTAALVVGCEDERRFAQCVLLSLEHLLFTLATRIRRGCPLRLPVWCCIGLFKLSHLVELLLVAVRSALF